MGKVKDLWIEKLQEAETQFTQDWDYTKLERALKELGFHGEALKERLEFAKEVETYTKNENTTEH